jgi:predicted small metal-binding protein
MNQVTCECGFTAQGGQEEQVVGKVLEHVRSDHPELVDNVTPEVVRGWIEIVPG